MKHSIVFGVIALALAGCGGGRDTGQADPALMFACVEQAGITGQYSSYFILSNGVQTRVIKPGNGVTAEQANAANACILSG
jgi:hypothetical protein